jgi:hypothetical protein
MQVKLEQVFFGVSCFLGDFPQEIHAICFIVVGDGITGPEVMGIGSFFASLTSSMLRKSSCSSSSSSESEYSLNFPFFLQGDVGNLPKT